MSESIDYEKIYTEFMRYLTNEEIRSIENVREIKEPDLPDTIDDRKKVIWFRNDVFIVGFSQGYASAIHEIRKEFGKYLKSKT